MANNSEKFTRSISMSSGDISVDAVDGFHLNHRFSDAVIDGNVGGVDDHGDGSNGGRVASSEEASRGSSSGSGSASGSGSGGTSGNCSNGNNSFRESSTSNHIVKAGGESKRYNRLSKLAAKLYDETVPLKKKARLRELSSFYDLFFSYDSSNKGREQRLMNQIKCIINLKWLSRLATVKKDGTVQFEVPGDIKTPNLDLGTSVAASANAEEEQLESPEIYDLPPKQIVMLIVGTRGDVQPFVAIGKRLQEYGHRVRLATHRNFKEFVLASGLEFFPLGGDPKILAGYMVKNKGFLPSEPSEIPIQRNQMREIIFSLLPACKEPDPESHVPFTVDAIIANPPAYGHTHVAEALKVPIHIFFTMPWTPTSEFPHPLSRVRQSVAYRLSYQVVDALIWLGIRDMINEFRKKKLKLRPVTYLKPSYSAPPDTPYGYIWSPHLVPKPKDWGPKIDVVGFCFLDLASNYKPPEDLVEWLEKGQKPIYIGFGSLPVQDPEKMTNIIVRALEITGQRGIINKGWGGLGNLTEPKDFVYLLDNVPHDWLFLQCAAVVHHGGAGTTAAGLKAACPTAIVPFFGDQPFWGEQVHAKGVGPPPIPIEEFALEKLVSAIRFMQDPKVKQCAVELAKAMENEDGVAGAVNAFHKHFPREVSEADHTELHKRHRSHLSIRGCFLGQH